MPSQKEKTQEERLREMLEIYTQLNKLGIEKQFEEMDTFYLAANNFIKHKTVSSGVIHLPMLQRDLYYEFILYHPKPSSAMLRYTGG